MRLIMLALLLLAACSGPTEEAHGQAPAIAAKPMQIGVSTHFGQGWPAHYWTTLNTMPAPLVRESVGWKLIEAMPGQYEFTEANVGHVRRLCAGDRRVVLVLLPKHPAYDSNFTVHTLAGRNAFGAYVAALAQEFGTCLAGVQIGNEINGGGNMTGPAASNRSVRYTAILKAVYDALAQSSPRPLILGGSTNVIGTGFLEQLFEAGALDYLDAVVVHPYRKDPANLDWELGLLRDAMARHGGIKPIWANEFSIDTTDTEFAANYLAKMLVQMSAAGVEAAFWYALADQTGFPNLGLVKQDGTDKPAAIAYRYWAGTVLPGQIAERIDHGDPDLFHYRIGQRDVIWGARRRLVLAGRPKVRDAQGKDVEAPVWISDDPVVVEQAGGISFGPKIILADSLYGYGRPPWSYFGQRPGQPRLAFEPITWKFTSFYGYPTFKPAAVNQHGLAPAGSGPRAVTLTVRYTADHGGAAFATACFDKAKPLGDGITIALRHNGQILAEHLLKSGSRLFFVPVSLARGDTLDFAFAPGETSQGDAIQHRIRIVREAADAARCR